MKFATILSQMLPLAALVSAAPHSSRQEANNPIPMAPVVIHPKTMTIEELTAVMQVNATTEASVAASVAEADTIMHTQAGCRNTIYKRWGTLSAQERTNFVNGIKCLMNRPPRGNIWSSARSLYDELVYIHGAQVSTIHNNDSFLPWHRYYLFAFRSLMSSECGFNGPWPWWKETNNAGNFAASDIFSNQWFGALPARQGDVSPCITTGAFAGIRDPFYGTCVGRGESRSETAHVTVAEEDICQGTRGNTYEQHRLCVEQSNHAWLHIGFGKTMSNAMSSPSDPIFFLHHSYIDWQWKRWQNVASWRWSTISGCATGNNPCAPLTRDTVLSSLGLFRDMRVSEVLDSEGPTTCYTYDLLV
ncbi:hypothetical protein Micbo1qcDRAFT_214040 [Microdochium bolleyi]|uniref:Tyrosinase copper-binding domain-containing protein n=1 Tax=Microdochium bolleyi TaxID=196109 RepID=A0A136IVH6_9PEZI|nr:hypothetical protein Micbo1qcDRAFT_214040 [Microdochium bolleyi]